MKKSFFSLNKVKVVVPAILFLNQIGNAQNITGSGATAYIPMFAGTSSITNSNIYNCIYPNPSIVLGGATAPIGNEYLSVQRNWNGSTGQRLYNNTSGTSASVNYMATANGSGIGMSAYSAGFTTIPNTMYEQGAAVLNGNGNTMNIGTTSNTQLTFWTNNSKRLTLTNTGDLWVNTNNQISIKGGDMNHGLGYNPTVDGPVLYGWSGGALAINKTNNSGGISNIALSWTANGNVTVNGGGLNTSVVMGRADGSSLNWGTSYVGFNAKRDPSNGTWTRYSDGANTGGGIIFGDVGGQINFSPMPTGGGASNVSFTDADVVANQTLRVRWNLGITTPYKGQVIIGQKTQDANAGNHNTALLEVNGDVVVGANGSANLWLSQTNWADFVFDENYKLMPLNEVENFYKENHHLPSVPTTKEVQANGNNLGQTDAVLLQKIEENTLYIVELKKQLDLQEKLIEELSKKLQEKK
jgi:hypothetical protein